MIEKLGPYRIERLLGRGGMGTVYEGIHETSGERAAIKALSVVLADDGNFRDRFIAEIETLKKLKHPNIVQLFGDGEQDGQLFYAMEMVDGRTLQDELRSGHRFEWQEVTQITIDVCQALKHAHDRGIVHRDLKPANLLRSPEGQIKLSDFGIAKLFGATHLTADGSVVGTADFMAPEQAEGRSVTNRTDLYSLGAVMFTMLARRPPFTGPGLPQVIHKLRYEEAPLVCRYVPQVPKELEQIVDQLLRKDPEYRVATASALANRLKAMQHALASGEEKKPPVDTVSKPDGDVPPIDEATRMVESQRDPPTEISPTVVDSAVDPPSRDSSGDEATELIASRNGSAMTPDLALSPATADPPALPTNRFTLLSDAERELADSAESQEGEGLRSLLQTLALAAALLALIAGTVWALWPPSADSIYQRITRISVEHGPAEAITHIDRFLERFPDDPRFDEIDGLRMDVACEWLQKRLALQELKSGGSTLEPYERDYLHAMRLKPKQLPSARERFLALLQDHADVDNPSQGLQSCLKAARHQLRRLDATTDGS